MRFVLKLGSSSLVDDGGAIRGDVIDSITGDVADAIAAGHEVAIVSSGAIAAGLGQLKMEQRPTELQGLQAASAVGQGHLFAHWATAFGLHNIRSAQLLMTMHDVANRAAYLNAKNTLVQLTAWGVVAVINENDTTATDEITFGDNDSLAAQVAVMCSAQALVLLTDADGLYDRPPNEPGAQLIEDVVDHSLLAQVETRGSSRWGTGGMRSKIVAAEMASIGGVATYICNFRSKRVFDRVAAGERVGTRFVPDPRPGSSFKLWLRYGKPAQGILVIDRGAQQALVERGASLLAVGVTAIEGAFPAGAAVEVRLRDGEVLGKGITGYASAELERLITGNAESRRIKEVIHRDELVLV